AAGVGGRAERGCSMSPPNRRASPFTSACMPTAGRSSSASPRCRRSRWSNWKNWNNCAPWRWAGASMSASSEAPRPALTLTRTTSGSSRNTGDSSAPTPREGSPCDPRPAGEAGTGDSNLLGSCADVFWDRGTGREEEHRDAPLRQTKHIFVTGGVVSSLGKGLTCASIGMLLEHRGLRVRLQKFDPYINVDPGTMSPYQHGEVYVLDDGAETDLDLGHYERFTN